jgi:UDP:flavonoid glycosyltransferase YjiC (YdhE family)
MRTEAGERGIFGKRLRRRDRWLRKQIGIREAEEVERLLERVHGWNNPHIVAAVGSIPAYKLLWRFGSRTAKVISCPWPCQPSKQFTLLPPDLSLRERMRCWKRALARRPEHRRFCEETFHLVSVSPAVFPRPVDWLPNMQVTGYIPYGEAAGWCPPAALLDFLADGPPPVYVGFSNHAVLFGPRGEERLREIVLACQRFRGRAIVHSPDVPASTRDGDVYTLREPVPHAWLFPRCAAVVHHGGYGTIHEALIARKPMVIYPFQSDQFLWATRIGELGIGPGYTARLEKLSAARLLADLAFVLRPECRANAERVGEAMMVDDGLGVQTAAVESIVAHTRRRLRPLDWRMPSPSSVPAARMPA